MTQREPHQCQTPGGAIESIEASGGPLGSAGPADQRAQSQEPQCAYLSRVSAYHDGELTREEGREVAAHLTTCRPCAAAMAFFDRVSGTFAAEAPRRLEPAARGRLRSLAAATEAAGGGNVTGYQMPAHVRWVRRLTAVAAALFVVAVCRLAYHHHFEQPGVGTTPAGLEQPVGPIKPPSNAGDRGATPPAPSDRPGDRIVPPVDDHGKPFPATRGRTSSSSPTPGQVIF